VPQADTNSLGQNPARPFARRISLQRLAGLFPSKSGDFAEIQPLPPEGISRIEYWKQRGNLMEMKRKWAFTFLD
jgi:hypothetical protein